MKENERAREEERARARERGRAREREKESVHVRAVGSLSCGVNSHFSVYLSENGTTWPVYV